ncbi:MAG: hypothetical protein ACFFD7_16455, partial [Candidatus Thorarchaeota archaeon]
MKRIRKVKKRNTGMIIFLFAIGFLIGSFSTDLFLRSGKQQTHITIIYSSEKASWMTIAYTDFITYWQSEYPDKKISINMHPYGSSDSIIAILNREIFPTIWSPASSIWMPFLNSKWADLTKLTEPIVNISKAVKIIYSPVVIATWEAFNQTYGIKGFLDLHNLILN